MERHTARFSQDDIVADRDMLWPPRKDWLSYHPWLVPEQPPRGSGFTFMPLVLIEGERGLTEASWRSHLCVCLCAQWGR